LDINGSRQQWRLLDLERSSTRTCQLITGQLSWESQLDPLGDHLLQRTPVLAMVTGFELGSGETSTLLSVPFRQRLHLVLVKKSGDLSHDRGIRTATVRTQFLE
jgi:hypothetical protein